jgi:hypothetical protein
LSLQSDAQRSGLGAGVELEIRPPITTDDGKYFDEVKN